MPFSTLAEAQAENFVLFEGERWTEKDPATGRSTGRQKVGDGVETPPGSGIAVGTAFNDLPFEPSGASGGAASGVTFAPAGTIAATNVQAAVQEVATDAAAALAAHEAAADPHSQYLTQTEGDARYRQSSTALTDSDIPAGIARDSEVSAAITAHESASDPHSQYLTQAEGDGRYRQTATALTDSDIPAGIARDSEVTAAITAHESAADPHPGYLTQSEGDGRYRQTATALTDSDIPAGIARDSEVTAAIATHEGAADPHPGYLTTAEGNAAYARALTTNAAVTAGTNSQGQAPLTADTNVITSTPNNPSAVTLGTPAINQPPVVVINAGSNPVNVFPPTGVQIDTAGANNPYSLAVGARIDFIGTSATQWRSSSIERTSVSFLAGTGTGVNTALAVNVGSAGAFVTFNGAGGTPSSLSLVNATGLPLGSVTGLGTGIAAALAINTGSAGAPVLFNGAGGTPSSLTLTNATGLPTSGITNFNADIRAQIEAALIQGSNVTITPSGSGATRQFTVAATGGGGSLTVQDEGTTLSTAVTTINFTGAGATATGAGTVTVDIPGGGGGVTDGDKGDITVSASGSTWTIDNGAVTLAKQANLTTQRIIGRNTAGSGVPEEVSLSQLLDWGSTSRAAILSRGASGWQEIARPTVDSFLSHSGASNADPVWSDSSILVFRASGLSQFPPGSTTSAQLRVLLSDETGTGLAYFQGGNLGTPSGGTLTNCTGLPTSGITNFNADTRAQTEATLVAGANFTITPSGTGATRQLTLTATGGTASAGGSTTQVQFNNAGALAGAANVEIKSDNLQLTAPSSTPGAADASSLIVYPVAMADRFMAAMLGPIGAPSLLQPSLFSNNVMMYSPQSGTTGTGGNAFQTAWTSGGTVSHPTPAATNLATSTRRTRWANVVTTQNQQLGVRMNTDSERCFHRGSATGRGGFFFFARFGFSLVPAATIRVFAGLQGVSATQSIATADAPPGPYCGLVHRTTDPLTGSGAFLFATHDGASVTREPITLASTIGTDTLFDFTMYCPPNGSTIYFRLDDLTGGATYTFNTTSTLPATTAMMSPQAQASNGTANVTVDTLRFELAKVYAESVY